MPSRINLALGGSPRCRDDALVNDIGLVSVVRDGVAGYELWAGGSLGKAPSLAVLLAPFVPRSEVLPAVDALLELFIEEQYGRSRRFIEEHPFTGKDADDAVDGAVDGALEQEVEG